MVYHPTLHSQKNKLHGSGLKLIACLSMLTDHIAAAFSFQGVAHLICRQLIGRLAFPLFCFLLSEGYRHTRHLSRYFFNLLLFALASEVPFDLALGGVPFSWLHQNTMFTLCLGLVLFRVLDLIARRTSHLQPLYTYGLQALSATVAAAGSFALHLDYSWYGILCLLAFYLFPGYRLMAALAAILMLNLNNFGFPAAFLSIIPICLYDGTRGRQQKYAFYVFYPAHLLLFWIVKLIM